MSIELQIPIPEDDIRSLIIGDTVLLSGIIVTARDIAHKWLSDHFIQRLQTPTPQDQAIVSDLKTILNQGVIFHCGPVVSGLDTRQYQMVAAGPTTSMREETYQADVIRLFNLKGVIGKGGMGQKTLDALHDTPAVYFHAIGGAAAVIAQTVTEVLRVHQLEFGVPEAMWVIRVDRLPVVVTMDSHRGSLHDQVRAQSRKTLDRLLKENH